MKPYSLEWWLKMLEIAIDRESWYLHRKKWTQHYRYVALKEWIRQRIINKFQRQAIDNLIEIQQRYGI
jgi:hypothetical protein